MPVKRNDFDRFESTEEADRMALEAIGIACMQVAQPACPVRTGNLRRSHRYVVSGDHVDIGVTADYGGHVHNGTSKRRANPWLRNAVQANKQSIAKLGARAWEERVGL